MKKLLNTLKKFLNIYRIYKRSRLWYVLRKCKICGLEVGYCSFRYGLSRITTKCHFCRTEEPIWPGDHARLLSEQLGNS